MQKEGMGMLTRENAVLVIVDVQGNLALQMHDKAMLFKNMKKVIKGFQTLEIPILWLEQNPRGLGPTIPEIAKLLSDSKPISKMTFSCCGNDSFLQALKVLDRKQVLISGIEAHICVYQTAMDLLRQGLEVTVMADAVSSRTAENKQIALHRLAAEGAAVASTEMVLFELLKTARHPQFRQVAKLVK